MKSLRFNIGSRHFYAGTSHKHKMLGVNSTLVNGNHFLMWDFDHEVLIEVVRILTQMQLDFGLPGINVLRSSENSYHAYCFAEFEWPDVVSILAHTPRIDKTFWKLGVLRGYFTLRISDKRDGILHPVAALVGTRPSDVDPFTEIQSFAHYWTRKG